MSDISLIGKLEAELKPSSDGLSVTEAWRVAVERCVKIASDHIVAEQDRRCEITYNETPKYLKKERIFQTLLKHGMDNIHAVRCVEELYALEPVSGEAKEAVKWMREALKALYLEVDGSIVIDLQQKFDAVLKAAGVPHG